MTARPTPHRSSASPVPFSTLTAAVLLVGAIAAAYVNALHAPFVFDDRASILENPTIRSLGSPADALSPPAGGLTVSGRPLVNLSLAINYTISGTSPWSYHLVNTAIHALAALTLFGIVHRTLAGPTAPRSSSHSRGDRASPSRTQAETATAGSRAHTEVPRPSDRFGANGPRSLAFATALLWALHPLQTASVTYVVQRAEALAGLLYLLTLYLFIRGTASPRPWRWFGPAVIACLAGHATKEITVTAPIVVLLHDRTFVAGSFAAAWRQRRAVHLALAATWIPGVLLWSGGRGGTVGFSAGVCAWDYLLTQCEALVRYLRLALWPDPLVFDYGTRVVRHWTTVLPQALVVLALLLATVWALRRRPLAGFFGASFFLILAPTSSFVPIASQTIAEHRMYLPLACVLAGGVMIVGRRWPRHALPPLIALAVLSGWLTIQRNRTYQSEVSLWADTAAKAPDNVRAHLNLGSALLDANRPEEALAAYERARELRPDDAGILAALCHVLTRLDRLEEAATAGAAAVQLDPRAVEARVNYAHVLRNLGRRDAAIEHALAAWRLQPEASDVRLLAAETLLDRARAAARTGRLDDAARDVDEASSIAPELPEVPFLQGNIAIARRDVPSAIAAYQRAVELAPNDANARNNLANALLLAGRAADAIAEYERVLVLKPDDASVRENLAHARALLAGKKPVAPVP